MGHSSYPRSAILVLSQSSIYSLLPSTLFAQVESLLQNGRLAEAEVLLERTEADLAQRGASPGNQTELLCYLHQCLAFTFMRQTRFQKATPHFVKGAIDPRVPISYFDEIRPALFNEAQGSERDGNTTSRGVDGNFVEIEIWDGIEAYMPDETSVDDIIATNLVRNYSPYLRPGAISDPSAEDEREGTESTSDVDMKSGTRTHPATVAMREMLRGEANNMLKSILAAVLVSGEIWSREVIEVASTALALLYAHTQDVGSLLALFTPQSSTPSTSSHPVSRSSSRPPSRPGSTSRIPNAHQTSMPTLPLHSQHTPHPSQVTPVSPGPAFLVRPQILAPVLAQLNLWGALVEMWKTYRDGEKVLDVLVGLTEGTYVDPQVINPLEQIYTILTRPDASNPTNTVGLNLTEHERTNLVRKWAAWLAGKDVERGLKLLTSLQPMRHGRPNRGRDRGIDREKDKGDELVILSELRNTNTVAARRYLEWLVVGRGLGRGEKEATEEWKLFEELVRNCVEEVLEYAGDESIGKLWRAKAASYTSSPSTPSTTMASLPPPPPPKSDPLSAPIQSQLPLRPPFVSYFSLTTPESPSKRARIKTLLLLQSLKEGKQLVRDIQDRITGGGWDKILGLEMAILHSKIPSPRIALKMLYALRDTSTAESYASSGGLTGVISTNVGVSAAEGCGLSDWSGWFAKGNNGTKAKGEEKMGQDSHMLKILLEVYMEDGDTRQTAWFLSSQAKKLDTLDILPLVPSDWPLSTLSTYLARSLRRTQHAVHEGQIVRAICAGRNLAVLGSTFEVLREAGALVEEAISDEEGEGEGVARSYDEKVVLHGVADVGEVANVHVGGET